MSSKLTPKKKKGDDLFSDDDEFVKVEARARKGNQILQ